MDRPGVPGGGLPGHEARGGHTLAEHVARSEESLRRRIAEAGLRHASTFDDEQAAESAVAAVLDVHGRRIAAWLKRPTELPLVLEAEIEEAAGFVVSRSGESWRSHRAKVILDLDDSALGYLIVTAYPA